MARKSHDDALGVAGGETIIGTGVTLKGNLKTESDLAIDGQLEGNILSDGNVTIGVNARILGNIQGSNITAAGEVVGNLSADGETSLLATSQIKGNVRAASISVASGAILNGQVAMKSPGSTTMHDSPANSQASTTPSSGHHTDPNV